jgi:hypothetical protein
MTTSLALVALATPALMIAILVIGARIVERRQAAATEI